MAGMIFMVSCGFPERQSCPEGENIMLSWEFKGNDPGRGVSEAIFIIKNTGNQSLGNDNWMLYYSQMGKGVVRESVTGHVQIDHINGDLHRISPLENFELEPGGQVEIAFEKPGRLIKENEAPAGPYFVFGGAGNTRRKVIPVRQYSVKPFPGLAMIFPPGSGIPLPDAAWVYEQNRHQVLLDPEQVPRIIPTPVQTEHRNGVEILEQGLRVCYPRGLENEAEYLSKMLDEVLTGGSSLVPDGEGGPNTVLLAVGNDLSGSPEAYRLTVASGGGVSITGGGSAGLFYGIQSLLAMLPVEGWNNLHEKIEIEYVTITDSPAFEYRGIMLDVARNFHRPEAIRKLMDIMAFYKLNRLHLSLTNDEAWRLEIPSLPELTGIGGYRGHTEDSRDHMIPAYGSGPFPDPEKGVGSGFLSRSAFIELLEYANRHHIEVIPEINFPGHARAAIFAMEARYERLMEEGKTEEAERYRLIDPDDSSLYNSAQNFNDNVACVCMEAPFLFFETVVDEVSAMYREAGLKLKVMHTGGDEVPRGSWTGSAICEAFLKEHPDLGSAADLQVYFEKRLLEILSRKELMMAGWEEIVLKRDSRGEWIPNPEFAGKGMLPYVWNSLGESLDLGNRVANAGFPVVLCNVDHFYFDLAYSHHPSEPGLYWGGFVNTRNAWDFDPFHPEAGTDGMESLREEARGNIAGIQGQLWSETLKGADMLEYYYLPKMLGLAERAWAGQAWDVSRSWNEFANMIGQREMPRLDHIFGGYHYRIPPPGAVIQDGKLHASTGFPGLVIRYTTNGKDPQMTSPVYEGPVEVTGTISLRSFNSLGRGSRISVLETR